MTNDAVQKKNDNYGKFERGNKISYDELNEYIHNNFQGVDFYKDIYPQMKRIATDCFRAVFDKIDMEKRE